MNYNGVSVIICCHNGERRLPETVRHLAMQQVPSFIRWEFIFVDNGCTDQSAAIVEEIWDLYRPVGQLRIVYEPLLGLSFARSRGFSEAQHEVMIMCDDDNWLAPDYIFQAHTLMSLRKKIGALGGRGELVFEQTPPEYIAQAGIFAAGEQANARGKVRSNRVYGAGCIIRRSAYLKLQQVGFQSLLTDRRGATLASGGDHELCYALAILGYDIWYDDRLKFLHFITKERLTWEYFTRYARESACCFDVLTSYKMIAADFNSHKFSIIALSRDFLFVVRRWITVRIQQSLVDAMSVRGRLLEFKAIILGNKIRAYFSQFTHMVKNHDRILAFKESCIQAKLLKRPRVRQKIFGLFSL